MAKRVFFGHLLRRDKSVDGLYPVVITTPAPAVIFPDGKTLLEHWDAEMSDINKGKYRVEITKIDNDTFRWETNLFGNDNAVLNAHVVKGIRPQSGNTYRFPIKLPREFGPTEFEWTYDAASIVVTERSTSMFVKKKCLHTVAVEQVGDIMTIVVEHFKEVDGVDFSTETYINGDFDISVHIGFKN